MDDLTHILTFCRTVETGSVTEAAKSLHLTKSVASRRLSALEDNLGVALLKRSQRGAVPTEAGMLYYERARAILDELEDARQEVSGVGNALVGRLKVTAPRSMGNINLPDAFTSFMQKNEGVTLDLSLSDRRVDIIGEGYDVGMRIGSLADSSLIGKKLADVRRVVVASPAYLATAGRPETPDDLADHACIFYSNVEARSQWRFTCPEGGQKSIRTSGRLSANTGEMQLAAVLAGLGIAVIPLFYVKDALDKGELIELLSDYTQEGLGIYALYPPSRQQSAKVKALVDHLVDFFKQDAVKRCL